MIRIVQFVRYNLWFPYQKSPTALTSAGKSTLINYIHGCDLERVSAAQAGLAGKKKVIRVKPESKIPEMMRIGHSKQSETFVPEVGHSDLLGGLFLCDCPGFLDNRGPEINIANAVNIKQTLHMASGVKVLVVINYHSLHADRGRGQSELIQILVDLFGTQECLMENLPSTAIIVSQAPVRRALPSFRTQYTDQVPMLHIHHAHLCDEYTRECR